MFNIDDKVYIECGDTNKVIEGTIVSKRTFGRWSLRNTTYVVDTEYGLRAYVEGRIIKAFLRPPL